MQPSLFDRETLYTANVYLLYDTEDKKKVIVIPNIPGNLVSQFQKTVWTMGVKNVMDTGAIELINPFKIDKVLLTPQIKQ